MKTSVSLSLQLLVALAAAIPLALCSHFANAGSSSAVSCSSSPYILLGSTVQLSDNDHNATGDCKFTNSSGDTITLQDKGSGFNFSTPGQYSYICKGNLSGLLFVSEAQYQIALHKGNNEKEYPVTRGSTVVWTSVETECTAVLHHIADGNMTMLDTQGMSGYNFDVPGTYMLQCEEDMGLSILVTVEGNETNLNCSSNNTESETTNLHLRGLLYTHGALMCAAFGVLFPIGAFLAHQKFTLAHKLVQPTGVIMAVVGLIVVVTYVQLTSRAHFSNLIHGVVGLFLLLAIVTTPWLLFFKKARNWHKNCGHVVAFIGIGNVLMGLSILPLQKNVALSLCAIFGLWLVVAFFGYVFSPRPPFRKMAQKVKIHKSIDLREDEKTREASSSPRDSKDSFQSGKSGQDSNSTRGPQALTKGIVSEQKMIELRKKSLDFFEASKHREMLNAELGLTPMEMVPEEMDNRKRPPSPLSPPLHMQHQLSTTPEPDTPCSVVSQDESNRHLNNGSSTSEDEASDLLSPTEIPTFDEPHEVTIKKAQSFHHGDTRPENSENCDYDGGSLRVTRHSKRARSPLFMLGDPSAPTTSAQAQPNSTVGRRRKPALVPPIITTTPVTDQPSILIDRRGDSPLNPPSSTGSSPRPKKKVSVAHLEALEFPSTPTANRPCSPFTLRPPPPRSRSRSPSVCSQIHSNTFSDNALQSVMQMSHDAIVCANSKGEIIFWSRGAVAMFGYTPREAIGCSLELVIPSQYKHRHRNGIGKRTEDTLKYLKKHSYAPEEQKHARLYEVHGLAKNGREFPVEVNVTSFVIDEELFYTGVVSELAQKSNLVRSGSVCTVSSETQEATLKQRAIAVGVQMKVAHNLESAEYISKLELMKILKTSLDSSSIEIQNSQIQSMIEGIMKAGGASEDGLISYTNLIQLLSKNSLYISESGLIARYGKSKGSETNISRLDRFKQFVFFNANFFIWLLAYLAFNLVAIPFGLLLADRDLQAWEWWAHGLGPVLSINCVIIILPLLSSFIQVMRGHVFTRKVFPLSYTMVLHGLMVAGIFFWTVVHVSLHLCSFALDGLNSTAQESHLHNFEDNLTVNIVPVVTGTFALAVIAVVSLSTLSCFKKLLQFIPFHIVHWIGSAVFYLLLLIHGVDGYNPVFWKWFVPFALLYAFERFYRHYATKKYTAKLSKAKRYDENATVGVVEVDKPKWFKYNPGQYLLLNAPWIGYFDWHPCYISSGPKEDVLRIYVPRGVDLWSTEFYLRMKEKPYYSMPFMARQASLDEKPSSPGVGELTNPLLVNFSGPYGIGSDCVFDHKISVLVCGGSGPHTCNAIIKKFLDFRKNSCKCGCHPTLSKLYFVWVTPSGNDYEWFTDYLSGLCQDEHLGRYLDIRVFLTNINSPPDELASALLQLGLKTAGPAGITKRPSQPQLNLYSMTSYGMPDFDALLDYIKCNHANMWNTIESELGVFTIGRVHQSMIKDISAACSKATKPGEVIFRQHHIET